MKKKLYVVGLAVALACCAFGCGKKAEDNQEAAVVDVKADVVTFVNEKLSAAKAYQDSAIMIYNSYFSEDNTQDLAAFRESLESTAIPAMENCVNTINGIEVATEEVSAMKAIYLQSVQKEQAALKMVVSAIDGENPEYLTQADSLITESANLMKEYQSQLDKIAAEQGIIVNK